jgi:HlyD family secretion protein
LAKEDWQRLGDGYRVEARFVIWEDEDVLQVPASSLFRLNEGWALLRVPVKRIALRQFHAAQELALLLE